MELKNWQEQLVTLRPGIVKHKVDAFSPALDFHLKKTSTFHSTSSREDHGELHHHNRETCGDRGFWRHLAPNSIDFAGHPVFLFERTQSLHPSRIAHVFASLLNSTSFTMKDQKVCLRDNSGTKICNGRTCINKNIQILPLRPLELSSKPLNQRALAWSSDAELAVAADDSVYIFLPEFPIIDPNSLPESAHDDGPSQLPAEQRHDANGVSVLPAGLSSSRGQDEDNDDELLSSDSEADMDAAGDVDRDLDGDVDMEGAAPNGNTKKAFDNRLQFADGCRHIPVSRPSLTPNINAHIWNVAGKGMPVMHVGIHDQGDGSAEALPDNINGNKENGPAAEQQYESNEADVTIYEMDSHRGAGVGVIGSAGSSLNHIVAIEWSPAGLGRNLRPVLGVLTGCGSLIMYGEGSPLPFGSTVRPLKSAGTKGQSAMRNLESWLALWAVGENFVVPGQEAYGYGEYITAFAWCQEIGPRKALLAYMNDLRELVILCVGTAFKKLGDGLEEAVWNVKEVLRVETSGPHGQADVGHEWCSVTRNLKLTKGRQIFDPDFLPGGSSYCVRWSPWLKEGATWSCLLSYMDTNYIGFRKITLDAAAWNSTGTPIVKCDPQDWDGRCLHLGTDAFLEFENTVGALTLGQTKFV